jgi:hypothetical protein
MQFKIDKASFVSNFLQPINKIGEGCSIELHNGVAKSLVTDSTKSMFLYCEAKVECDSPKPIKLNIRDVLKLQKAIDCIEEDTPTFALNENHIQYKSKYVKFKYHLLEDGVIPVPTINIEKLLSLQASTRFSVDKQKYTALMRNSSFTADSSKLYIFTRDGEVMCELNDKTMPNLDSLEMLLSDKFQGNPFKKEVIIRLDALRNFSGLKFESICVDYVEQNQIMMLNINTENTKLKYVISPLTK